MKKATLLLVNAHLFLRRGLSLVVALFVACLSAVTFFTTSSSADFINVTATVPAPLPTSPAVIDSPSDQSVFDTQLVSVSGTCPLDGAYVVLMRNGASAGTALCNGGNFQLTISLVIGENALQALIYNITDGQGPPSSIVTVFYVPPSAPVPSEIPLVPITSSFPTTPAASEPTPPFILEYHYHYQVRNAGEKWTWDIAIHGGDGPYFFTVDWGDGAVETYGPITGHTLSISHVYKNAGTYRPFIRGSDGERTVAALQLLAVVNPNPTQEPASTAEDQAGAGSLSSYLVVGAPLGAVLISAIVHGFIVRGKLPFKSTKLR